MKTVTLLVALLCGCAVASFVTSRDPSMTRISTLVVKHSDDAVGELGRAGALACADSNAGMEVKEIVIPGSKSLVSVGLMDPSGQEIVHHDGLEQICQFVHEASETARLQFEVHASMFN